VVKLLWYKIFQDNLLKRFNTCTALWPHPSQHAPSPKWTRNSHEPTVSPWFYMVSDFPRQCQGAQGIQKCSSKLWLWPYNPSKTSTRKAKETDITWSQNFKRPFLGLQLGRLTLSFKLRLAWRSWPSTPRARIANKPACVMLACLREMLAKGPHNFAIRRNFCTSQPRAWIPKAQVRLISIY